jgi:hypothetical protein
VLALGMAACASAPAATDVPAVLVSPTSEVRAELARTVSEAMGGAPVALADDALTRESTLTVERARRRGPDGTPAQGRETTRPHHFRLVKSGEGCVLVHDEEGRRFPLAGATCVPVASDHR